MPVVSDRSRGRVTTLSARRVLARSLGMLRDEAEQECFVKMRRSCRPLCINGRHMLITKSRRALK